MTVPHERTCSFKKNPIIRTGLFSKTLFLSQRRSPLANELLKSKLFYTFAELTINANLSLPAPAEQSNFPFLQWKGVVISVSPTQEQQSLPSDAVLYNINQDWWVLMELQQPSEKGSLLTDEGSKTQTTPSARRNTQTHCYQSACKKW